MPRPVADPLAGLAVPVAEALGLSKMGSLSLGGNLSQTVGPGVYSQISVSGGASLTLEPGIYIITGGGFTVSGNASVSVSGPSSPLTGSGVMIYNAGSSYDVATGGDGGSFGAINFSGDGTVALAQPTIGTYAGVTIFQVRDNPSTLSFSGSSAEGTGGTIYAADAQLSISGGAQLQSPIIVNTLTLSGNGSAGSDSKTTGTAKTAGSPLTASVATPAATTTIQAAASVVNPAATTTFPAATSVATPTAKKTTKAAARVATSAPAVHQPVRVRLALRSDRRHDQHGVRP